MFFDIFPTKVLLSNFMTESALDAGCARFWLNHPIRWVQVIGIIVALTQKETSDIILRFSTF